MTRYTVVRKTLRDHRVATIAVALTVIAMAFLVTVIYPSYRDTLSEMEVPAGFEGFLGEEGWSTPEGFLGAEFFSWIPLILAVLAVIAGTAAVAGEEGDGTLDLLLAQPISRRRLLLGKLAGAALALALSAMLALPAFWAGQLFVDMPISNLRLVAGCAMLIPTALLYLAIAAWAGAALPTRGAAVVVASAVVVIGFFLQLIGAAVDSLHVLLYFSPTHWGDSREALEHGFPWLRAAGLLAVAALFVVLALRAFDRRDIGAAGDWSPVRALRQVRPRHHAAHSEPGPEPS